MPLHNTWRTGLNNLIYFIWWNKDNGMLDFNLRLLEQYIGMFDGKRIIKIADVKPYQIPDFLKEAEIVHNDPINGESQHFKDSLSQIDQGYTFYAHAKGVSRVVNKPLRWWVTQSYHGNLKTRPDLDGYLTSGCFGKLRAGSSRVPVPWHYSGSFFWFRKEVVDRYLSKRVPEMIDTRWFTECFCGWLVDKEDAQFRLHSSDEHKYNCYSEDFWSKYSHLIP